MTTPNPATLCPGCFKETGGGNPCPHCGFDAQAPRPAKTLAPRTLLHGQFLVGRVLGKPGGFGITYLGWDLGLHRRVAIKEFFPRDIAGRDTDRTTVTPDSTDDAEGFRYGLEQFQAEARTLARLDHPNIVRIHQVLAAHGTAYLVMEYYPGLTLAEHLDRQPGSRLPEATALALMQQILDGLRAVHAEGLLHRDIKPQNIYLAATRGGNARPVLIDFGAARQVAGERSRSLSVLLTEGYAPLEQYSRRGHQGPWTDIYAAAAVLYRMLTGSAPPDAHDRTQGEPLPPAARFGVSATVSAALDRALAMAAGERPQSVVELQEALAGGKVPPAPAPAPALPPAPRPPPPPPPPEPGWKPAPWVGAAALFAIMAVLIGLRLWVNHQDAKERAEQERAAAAEQVRRVESELVRIPAGRFLMGSPPGEAEREDNEGSQHQVEVPAFELGKYEVTFDQWDACVTLGGCTHRPDDEGWGRGTRPVINVSWDDAQEYVKWLSAQTGTAYRLPSEAEWEYAARAGTTTAFNTGNCITTAQANYDANDDYAGCGAYGVWLKKTQSVGSYAANRWGLSDMHGNVWELVQDCYHDSYTLAPKDGSEWRDFCFKRGLRVLRGGSWYFSPRNLRSANRSSVNTFVRGHDLGFRVARTLTP